MTPKPHVAVIGKTGQLARALAVETAAQGMNAKFYDRAACDLSSPRADIESFVAGLDNPTAIIIAAAYTNVDAAETDRGMAMSVNAHGPIYIAEAAARRGIPIVHISTDYVFNGQGTTPYPTTAPTDPINYYGLTKETSEQGILNTGGAAAIIRTSWVYDGCGRNFVTAMLKLAQTRPEVGVVGDQFGRPTYARDLAKAVLLCADGLAKKNPKVQGIFHYSNAGDPISWADFAAAIFDVFSDEISEEISIKSIPSSEYPTDAARPAWSVLELTRFERNFKNNIPHWLDALKRARLERMAIGR